MATTFRIVCSIVLLIAVVGSASAQGTLRNVSTLPVANYSLTISPWENHYQFPPVSVPSGTVLTFLWNNDDHGVYLVENDQCPDAYTPGKGGQQELFPVTSKTAGVSNYTTILKAPGLYHFVCQEGTHCLQGQRILITVFNSTQGIPGAVQTYAPGPQTGSQAGVAGAAGPTSTSG
ncbi:hypothetical protein WJX72_011730 [[Myrmecia] bisecta]|uniref:Phytocyanin domain-containing protein n=1 Tax=[Myrmecia] bisecta TaxID=41462 RepID=A0AAW1RA56_9CHLO